MNNRIKRLIKLSILFAVFTVPSIVFAGKNDVFNLKYTRWSPGTSTPAKIDREWTAMVEEKSEGRLKIKCYFDGALAGMRETYRAVQTGVADIGYYAVGINPGLTDLNKIMGLPLIGARNTKVATAVYRDLLETIPELKEEFRGIKILSPRAMAPSQMHFTRREVKAPSDLKGMKIIAYPEWNPAFKPIGVAPVTIQIPDWYMSLERNMVEGVIVHFPAVYGYRILDLLPNHTDFGDSGVVMMIELIMVNQKKWDSLPDDLKQVMRDIMIYRETEFEKDDARQDALSRRYSLEKNHSIYQVSASELDKWQQMVKPIHQAWIQMNAKRGPSQLVYDKAIELINKYNRIY